MKYVVLALAALSFPLLSLSAAQNYSCRDNSDLLHIADNLMSLPEECRDRAKTSSSGKEGKVNYVPAAVQTRQSDNDFAKELSEEAQRIEQRKREADDLVQEAEDLASSYENAVAQRKMALRHKNYGNRSTITLALDEMRQARKGKKNLLAKLPRARLSSPQRKQIETILDRVRD